MEKQKRWQLVLILAVIAITVFNILPTIFYYGQPLDQPVNEAHAQKLTSSITHRIDDLEKHNLEWLKSYSKNLGISPRSISLLEDDSSTIEIQFAKEEDKHLFKKFFKEAALSIPSVPAQLTLIDSPDSSIDSKVVRVKRKLQTTVDSQELNTSFTFSTKFNEQGLPSDLYKKVINDRLFVITKELGGQSSFYKEIQFLLSKEASSLQSGLALAQKLDEIDKSFGSASSTAQRFYLYLAQNPSDQSQNFSQALGAKLKEARQIIEAQEAELQSKLGASVAQEFQEQLQELRREKALLQRAETLLTTQAKSLTGNNLAYTDQQIQDMITKKTQTLSARDTLTQIDLENRHPFISQINLDWKAGKVLLNLHEDIAKLKNQEVNSETANFQKEQVNYLLFNEIARLKRETDEEISPDPSYFTIQLNELDSSHSFMALDLGAVAKQRISKILHSLEQNWHPQHQDLKRAVFPLLDWKQFSQLSPEQKELALVVLAPANTTSPMSQFDNSSLYVIAKGLNLIFQKINENPESESSQLFLQDWKALNEILKAENFHLRYLGKDFADHKEFTNDIIFRQDNFFQNLLTATRENFKVRGSKRYAVLEFSNLEQRILASNKIEDSMHEELLRWKQDYQKAQVALNPDTKYKIPPPTQSAFWENVKLSSRKYLRGDDRKIIKWGLDLKGGRSVRVGLKDQNGQKVIDPVDLNQARNELYNRVNKMGVAEVSIRIEGNNIILDFPSSQNFSAKELIKASAMYFHVVNEKFGLHNPDLAKETEAFLQGVWNEAVVTNKTDHDSLQEIAWNHLTGGVEDERAPRPRTEQAKKLYEAGLRLYNPNSHYNSHAFNDTLSMVTKMSGDSGSNWGRQNHPLLICFKNYALEGSSLENVQAQYDSSEGHFLAFSVRGSYARGNVSGDPRQDFYQWTSQFSKEGIKGTPKESFSAGEGWRLAVLLNGQVISAPTLNASLKNQARIVGRFSQREVAELAADLKAGSLSFTPVILSEENVSPELGQAERDRGINATLIGLGAIIVAMLFVYRFAGFVSSVAILFNLLIMWGVLQNLGAVLTLSGIAGIILTIGMSVDANVLVFERIREEFKNSGKIASAIQAGYKKAFSAILDSNITTIIAALILLQFDSGPIKSFAVTMVIGIVSSMFTALFMTRYYFTGWLQNPKNTSLKMARLIQTSQINFLSKFKYIMTITLVLICAGSYLLVQQKNTILGMDFTGGYAITLDFQDDPNTAFRQKAEAILADAGAASGDVQVRELNQHNQLYVQLGRGLDQEGAPFYNMPEELDLQEFKYSYEKNPRLSWLVQTFAKEGLVLKPHTLTNLSQNWKLMSGQLSDAMKSQAILSLGLAMLCILIYITVRFEFKYGISAIIALASDVLLSISLLSILNWMGLPIQIDMQVIGAIMTIIGYSLNDTIIVFDRIREDIKTYRRLSIAEVVNQAINTTLNRTLMTSGTTLLVLLSLLFFSGQAIFSFSLVMTIGVIVGTISSIFVASPIMLFFHKREAKALQHQQA